MDQLLQNFVTTINLYIIIKVGTYSLSYHHDSFVTK